MNGFWFSKNKRREKRVVEEEERESSNRIEKRVKHTVSLSAKEFKYMIIGERKIVNIQPKITTYMAIASNEFCIET